MSTVHSRSLSALTCQSRSVSNLKDVGNVMKPTRTLSLLVLLASTVIFAGCAHRSREVDSGKSATDVMAGLNAALNSTSSNGNSFVADLASQPDTTVFYFDGGTDPSTQIPSNLGEVDSVLAADFSSLVNGVTTDSLTFVQGYFVVHKNADGGLDGALIIGYSQASAAAPAAATTAADGTVTPAAAPTASPLQYVIYTSGSSVNGASAGTITDGEFSMSLQSETGSTITVSSFDLSSDGSDLATNIQLELSNADGTSIGQISSLEGY
jgi:hypothetical protein